MLANTITRIATNLLHAYNSHDLDQAASLYSQDYEGIDVARPEPQRGPEGIRASLAGYFSAFPDLSMTEDEVIETADRIVQIWTARGTHRGTFMNIPPSGRRVTIHGISVLAIDAAAGQVRRGYYIWDVAGLLRSIGLLPEL